MTIQDIFRKLKDRNEAALIVYLTAGFPDLLNFMDHIQILVREGADMIEIGLPFSDPIADGPTIQYASQVALKDGINLHKLLGAIQEIDLSIPLILMSYLNPLLAYGVKKLFKDLKQAGFSGLIVPDLPVEEAGEWIVLRKETGINLIFLVAPTSSEKRIRQIAEMSSGFIYCVTTLGTTGARYRLPPGLPDFMRKIRRLTDMPLAAGFGISTDEQIRKLCDHADGVIVGSRIIEAIRKGENLERLIRQFKDATRKTQAKN